MDFEATQIQQFVANTWLKVEEQKGKGYKIGEICIN